MSTKVKINYVIVHGTVRLCKTEALAQAYSHLAQRFEDDDSRAFEEELEFDEHGELLDKYCVNVKEALEQRIADQWTNNHYPDEVEDLKKWLSKIKEAENKKEKYKKKKNG